MSLLLAVQANDYEAVLRLLYLNPFIGAHEKSDGIWCCTAAGNLSLLRTLLEDTNVDVSQVLKPSSKEVIGRIAKSSTGGVAPTSYSVNV